MSAEPRALARNTSHFTLALVAQKVISFLYFTYLARIFAPAEIGQYVFALSFTTIFSVFIDIGLGYVLTTEVAKDKTKAQSFWENVIFFKLVSFAVAVVLAWAIINVLGYTGMARDLVYIAFIIMVIDSLVLSAYSLIRAFQNLWWESIGTVLFQITVVSCGFLITLFTRDLRLIMLALIVGGFVNLTYSWSRLKKFGISIWPKYHRPVLKQLLILAWPFGLALILTRLYGYVDSVLLSVLAGDEAVGFYSVAYKIAFAWQFIASAFAASLLPGFSAYIATAKGMLPEIFSKAVHYLNIVSFPLAGGFIVLAPAIIKAVYPQYLQSVLPLQILMVSLVFLFLTFPVGSLLSASGLQKRNTWNLLITVVISVIINFVLIPKFGAAGAASASLISSLVYFLVGWFVISKVINLNYREIFLSALKVLLATIVMSFFMFIAVYKIHLGFVLLLGIIIYFISIIIFKGLSLSEIKELKSIVFSKNKV